MTVSTDIRPSATLILKTAKGKEMSVAMELISAEAAGELWDFDAGILAQLRRYGVVSGDGDFIDVEDAGCIVGEIRRAMAPFEGKPILISEAAKKYGFSRGAIYGWVADQWVEVLIEEPRRQVNEADLILARQLADRRGHIEGRAVFPAQPRSGRPKKS